MTWLQRFRSWLRSPQESLLDLASEIGTVTLQQTFLEDGPGWQCSIRAKRPSPSTPRPMYAWTGFGKTIALALKAAVAEATAAPLEAITGGTYAPKLGGAEFSPE